MIPAQRFREDAPLAELSGWRTHGIKSEQTIA
nr:MAG TPA: hypothetical protein [Caudoviricetes sp.]